MFRVEDWDVFYIDGEMVDEGHHVPIELVVNEVIRNDVKVFKRVCAINDIPREDDPLERYWFVPEGSARKCGWWEFPAKIDEEDWQAFFA
jgi:hypothetical protein